MVKASYSSMLTPVLPVPTLQPILQEGENIFHRPFATNTSESKSQNLAPRGFPRAVAPALPWIPGVSKPNGAVIEKKQFIAGVAVGFVAATIVNQLLNKALVTALSLVMAATITAIPAAALYIGNTLH